MGAFIENRSIQCNFCGYNPIIGVESDMPQRNGVLHECRWTCPRCGQLVRRDEKLVAKKEEPKENETK